MRGLIVFTFALVCFQVQANYVHVSRKAVIRDQANSSAEIIETVEAGTNMELLDGTLYGTGYLKVKSPKGKTGFVYKSRVRVRQGQMPEASVMIYYKAY